MKRLLLLSALLLTFGLSGNVIAQQPEAEPAPPPPPPAAEPPVAVDVSDEELETFVDIYVDLQEAAERFQDQMATAETQEEAQQAQEQMREESIATIEEHGWSLDQYNSIAQAINSNPELIQEALQLIEERS